MSNYAEYTRGPWRLRALHVPNQRVEGWEHYDDAEIVPVLFIWFVGRMDDDQWFAYGLSDFHDHKGADEMSTTINGERMDVLLSLAGYSWEETVETDVAELAQLQRRYEKDITEDYWTDLLRMGRTELEDLRATEEHEISLRWRHN